jgi:Gpi18-like mannosyltransferase
MREAEGRVVRARTYTTLFLLFAGLVFLTRAPWLTLPCYWDECGYYLPAAFDLLRGWLITHSVPANIHPPGLSLWLAAVWRVTGFSYGVTRCAMLVLASGACAFAMLLAIDLLKYTRGMPAFLAAGLVCFSPLFFAQSLLAQPDMPAMLFTSAALWLFLRNRSELCAAACAALVLMKETGMVAPAVFAAWLLFERRPKRPLGFSSRRPC